MTERPELPSLSTEIEIAGLGDEPLTKTLEADEQDCVALAAFLDLPAMSALAGHVTLLRSGSLITIQGHLTASLTRHCVASLEEMPEEIDEEFIVTYTDAPVQEYRAGEELEADLDAPEPLEGPHLDLAAVLLEQLYLAMHPHPRKEDAAPIEDPKAGERISPFAALEALKPKE